MAIIFDGTQGITTPAETANNSVTTPIVKSPSTLTLQTNGSTTAMTIDTSQNVGIGTTSPSSYGPDGSRLAVVNTTSGQPCNMSIVNNSTDLYEGGGLLLGNSGLTTNYDATFLYHHKFNAAGNDYSAFNISQRRVDGTYISNIWNVDYKNNVHAFYRPNTGAQVMGLDASGNLQFNSGYGSVATAYGVRAWINYNGTNNAIRASGGVSSITDRGTGNWDVNFSFSMPDANYSALGSRSYRGVTNFEGNAVNYARVYCAEVDVPYLFDPEFVYVAIVR